MVERLIPFLVLFQKNKDLSFVFSFTATPRNSMLDSFFALKSGLDMGKASSSTSSQSTSMSFKDGQFSIEIDIQVTIRPLRKYSSPVKLVQPTKYRRIRVPSHDSLMRQILSIKLKPKPSWVVKA